MKKVALTLAVCWFATISSAKAGELDSEYGGKAKVAPAAPSIARPAGELDSESPTQAWYHGRPFFGGFGFGFGFGGFGYGGFGYGYPASASAASATASAFAFGGFGYGRGFGYGGYGFGIGGRTW